MSEEDRMERAGDINRDFISKYMKQIRAKKGLGEKMAKEKRKHIVVCTETNRTEVNRMQSQRGGGCLFSLSQ